MGSYDGSAALSYENFRSDIEKQHLVSRSGGGGRPMTEERLAYWQKDMQRLVYDDIERCFKDLTHSSWIITGSLIYEQADISGVRIWFSLDTPDGDIKNCTMYVSPPTVRVLDLPRTENQSMTLYDSGYETDV